MLNDEVRRTTDAPRFAQLRPPILGALLERALVSKRPSFATTSPAVKDHTGETPRRDNSAMMGPVGAFIESGWKLR